MKKVRKQKPIPPVKPEEFFQAEEVFVERYLEAETYTTDNVSISIDPSWPTGTEIRLNLDVSSRFADVSLKIIGPKKEYPNPAYASEMKRYERALKSYSKKLAAWEEDERKAKLTKNEKRIAELETELAELKRANQA